MIVSTFCSNSIISYDFFYLFFGFDYPDVADDMFLPIYW